MERKNGFLYFSPTDQCINEQCWLAFFLSKTKRRNCKILYPLSQKRFEDRGGA